MHSMTYSVIYSMNFMNYSMNIHEYSCRFRTGTKKVWLPVWNQKKPPLRPLRILTGCGRKLSSLSNWLTVCTTSICSCLANFTFRKEIFDRILCRRHRDSDSYLALISFLDASGGCRSRAAAVCDRRNWVLKTSRYEFHLTSWCHF